MFLGIASFSMSLQYKQRPLWYQDKNTDISTFVFDSGQMATSFLNTTGAGMYGGGPGEELDHAASVVDQAVVADRNYVDLSDMLQVPKHSKINSLNSVYCWSIKSFNSVY